MNPSENDTSIKNTLKNDIPDPHADNIYENFPLEAIYFYITGSCNLKCRHCWIDPRYVKKTEDSDFLPFQTIRSIIEQAIPLGLSSVKLTGGEPLLNPDISKILEYLQQTSIRVAIETNGTLLTQEIANKIAECNGPFVSVSLDGCTAETHEWVRGVPGCFNSTLEGLQNLQDAGVKPQLIFTLMRRNMDEVFHFIDFAKKLEVGSVKVNILEPTSRGKKMHDLGERLGIGEYIAIGEKIELINASDNSFPIYYSHPIAFRPLSQMFSSGGCGCSICGIHGIIGVLCDGSYALCGVGSTEPELSFGKSDNINLKEIWSSHPILNEIRKGLPNLLEGVCAVCGMKKLCLGSCIAQNYVKNRSLWAPNWYCDAAFNEDLFPSSRLFPGNRR